MGRERDSWFADRARLERQAAALGAAVRGPAATLGRAAGTAELVQAVVDAAALSGVQIARITPTDAGQDDAEDALDLNIEGSGSIDAIGAFLDNLWGIEITDLSVQRAGDGSSLNFSIRSTPMPTEELESFDAIAAENRILPPLTVAHDPFVPRPPPPLPRPGMEPAQAAPAAPEPALDLRGLRLAGTIQIGDQYLAAVADERERTNLFLGIGDEARGYTVEAVTDSAVTFVFEGETESLHLPPQTDPEEQVGSAIRPDTTDYSHLMTWEDETRADDAMVDDASSAATPDLRAKAGARIGARLVALASEGSAADPTTRAGLLVAGLTRQPSEVRIGDLIASVNGVAVVRLEDALQTLLAATAGDQLTLDILREGVALTVQVIAEERMP